MTPTLTASARGHEKRKCDACGAKLEYLDETLCHRCADELEAL